MRSSRTRRAAFTLVELLVVIGLIALLATTLGVALTGKTGSSLASAQQTVAALCGTARAQAALHQTETRIVVHATRPTTGHSDKYLRVLQVFRAEPDGSDAWMAAGPPVYLPRGIYLVPPEPGELLATGIDWATRPLASSNLASTTGPLGRAGTEFGDADTVLYLQFGADGLPSILESTAPLVIVVAAGDVSTGALQFTDSALVRGVAIRRNGSVGFVDRPGGP